MTTIKDLYIIGAGGFGREVAWLVERINAEHLVWNMKGFIDDNSELWGTTMDDYPVLGGCNYLLRQEEAWVVCAVGSSYIRQQIIEKVEHNPNVHFATLIDPSVIMSNRVQVGEGSIICAGNIMTVDISVGRHCIINLDCTIGHDAVLEDFVTLYPSVNVSGNVQVGMCTELGTGMQIIQGKSVANHVIIGAGAVVVRNITESGTYVGVPAEKKEKRKYLHEVKDVKR